MPPTWRQPPAATRRRTARQLAFGLGLIAALSVAPAVILLPERGASTAFSGAPAWVVVLLMIGIIQGAYATYLYQLPDWSSLRVTTIVTLGLSALYAMSLGMLWVNDEGGRLARWLNLEEGSGASGAARWCFILLCVTSLYSFAAGRVAARWRRITSE
jgi:hypothetical protein